MLKQLPKEAVLLCEVLYELKCNPMRYNSVLASVLLALSLVACDRGPLDATDDQVDTTPSATLAKLKIAQVPAKIALPFCETKTCLAIEVQTLATEDRWLDEWIALRQSQAIQSLIALDQKMSLQQAIDHFVAKSDQFLEQSPEHSAYELALLTRIASQRHHLVLLQLQIDSQQGEKTIQNQQYFFVADRQQKRTIKLLDIVNPQQQLYVNDLVQQAYAVWQTEHGLTENMPEKLYWGQADWFFDQEGIGIHYRAGQIAQQAPALDIYLTQAQTQQVLKAQFYTSMFQ